MCVSIDRAKKEKNKKQKNKLYSTVFLCTVRNGKFVDTFVHNLSSQSMNNKPVHVPLTHLINPQLDSDH